MDNFGRLDRAKRGTVLLALLDKEKPAHSKAKSPVMACIQDAYKLRGYLFLDTATMSAVLTEDSVR